jgi:ribonuclease HI
MPTPSTEHNTWKIWFDGAALPNPGRIGIGVLVVSPDGQRQERCATPHVHGCNNQAELLALIAAFELAGQLGARHLQVLGDSDVAISHVNGTSSTQVAALVPLIETARDWLGRFDSVALSWVPRHRNTEADRLCRQALGLPPKPGNKIKMKKRR